MAFATGALAPVSAFLAPRHESSSAAVNNHHRNSRRNNVLQSSSNMGWDNEDYLEALGKGPEALDDANAQYKKYSRFTNMKPASADDDDDDDENYSASLNRQGQPPQSDNNDDDDIGSVSGATGLSADQLDRIKRSNEQAAEAGGSEGGSRFQELMARTQKNTPNRSMPPPPPAMAQQQPGASAGRPPALPDGFEKLSVEAQAALFRQLMATPPVNDDSQQQWPPAPGPRPPATGQAAMSADGRRIGRNRDADAIVNTSDVYFAQLKLDSSVRNSARYSGDTQAANAVFADPSIQEIALHTNPYMEEARKKEQALLETAMEEFLLPREYRDEPPVVDVSDTGVSYKERLLQKKKLDGQKVSSSSVTVPPLVPQQQHNPTTKSTPPPPMPSFAAVPPPPPPIAIAPLPSPPPAVAASTLRATATQPAMDDTEGRLEIRTLMGLLLKHRGGPGFGAGRIQGAEMARFETLAANLLATLRTERGRTAALGSSSGVTIVPPPTAAVPPSSDRMSGGVRASPPVGDRIQTMMSCIDGAMQMYRNSPPAMQDDVLISLRAALLSAVGTCNEIVAELQVEQHEGLQDRAAPAPVEVPPSQFKQCTLVDSSPLPQVEGSDNDNTAFLEAVYQKLKDAKGDGKMGLRNDLSTTEALDLANDISRMRSLLVDELNSGPPSATSSSPPSTTSKYQEMLDKARADKAAGL